MQTRQT